MAEKKSESKIVVERTYNVPLRKGFQKAPKYRRAKKAVNVLREFISKHLKSDSIKIGKFLNLEIWKRGIKNPPHHVKVNVTKDSEGIVNVELAGAPSEKKPEVKPVEKAEQKEKPEETKAEVKPEAGIEKALKELEVKAEKVKEKKQEEAKKVEKQEIKELKQAPPAAPKQAKIISKNKEIKHPSDIDAKTDKMPKGGQQLEKHHGEGKQAKKE